MNVSVAGRRLQICLLLSLGLAGPVVAVAADAPADPGHAQLEEIVVTAQRRVENLQTVSIAVTSLSGDALNDKAVARLDDLQFASPALTITDAALTRSINIRGIGLASGSPQVTPGVATYVDGLAQPPIANTATFYDIGTIEALRGPQGTFVGSSSTGGAIFINSRSPDLGETNGYAEVSGGNYSNRGAQGAINLPAGDTFAIRIAGNYRERDSYFTDIGPAGGDPGELKDTSGRVGLLWKPNDAFQALFKWELTNHDTGGYAYQPIPTTTYAPLRSANIRNLTYDDPSKNDERAEQSSLELRYNMAGGVILRSQSGYQDKHVYNLYDSDATIQPSPPPNPFPRVTSDQFVRERVFTQEFNLISPTDRRFDWVLGAYWQRNKIDVVIAQGSDGFPTNIDIKNDKKITGYFAQVGYRLTPQLKLNVGGRYSTFDVSSGGAVVIGRGLPFPPFNGTGLQVADLSGSHDDARPTGKVALEWTPTEDNLFYAFIARGYKPGGFNTATQGFEPETVLDYEVGWKATLLGGNLRTQIGAFWNDYTDFQLDSLNPLTGTVQTQNIADATIRGLEVQAQARLGGLGFDVGAAYVDSKLGEVQFVNTRALPPGTNLPQCAPGVPPGTPATCFDYGPYLTSATGRSMLYSPEFTFNAGLDYSFLVGKGTLRPRINYAYIDAQFTNLLFSSITDRLPAHGLFSAQLTYSLDNWSVEAYGTNLADKEYLSGQFGNNEFYGAPREYGLRASVRF
jgi:iron complex outermembrane recepter protein